MASSFAALLLGFLVCAAVTLFAGITLAKTTDTLDYRFKIGDALGGLVLLGISGNLPEIAIVFNAASAGRIPVIIGTLLGGIALQTLVIVIFDMTLKNKKPLAYVAGSPILALETGFAIAITLLALAATFIPAEKNFYGINPFSPLLFAAWLAGIFIINKARKNPEWNRIAADASPGRRYAERRAKSNHLFYASQSTSRVALIFAFACMLTLVAGVFLEKTGSQLATQLGINDGLFAATALSFVAALPEISTGVESIRIGDNHLAISDVMGGNAFLLTIFLFADLIAQRPILSYAQPTDIFLTVVGILMMSIYAVSFLKKPRKRYIHLGADSLLEICVYCGSICVLALM